MEPSKRRQWPTWIYPLPWTLLFCGCQTAFVPPTSQIPLFDGHGNLQISAGISTAAPQIGLAYSPIDRVGIIVSGGSSLRKTDTVKPNYFRFASLMAGYYVKPSSVYRLEIFAGIEQGWTGEHWFYSGNNGPNGFIPRIDDPADTLWRTITGTYTRTMLQINAGAAPLRPPSSSSTQSLEIGFSFNLFYLHYWRLTQVDSVNEHHPKGFARRELERNGALFFDPSLMLRGGDARSRLEIEIGTAHTMRDVDFNWSAFHASVGLRLFLDVGAAR